MFDQVLDAIGLGNKDKKSNSEEQEIDKIYDDFQRPPKIDIAMKHASATKFALTDANIDLDNTNVCPCCGLPTVIQELPLCSSRRDFSFNGSGVALYFDFLVFSCAILAVYGLIGGIYSFYDDSQGTRCVYENQLKGKPCNVDFYNQLSRTNVYKEQDQTGSILNCVAVIVIMVITLYYRNHINTIAQELDDAAILASDYSIFVENIPRDAKENEIREYFSQEFQGQQVELRKICMAYEIQKYLLLDKEKLEKESIVTKILELEAANKKVPARYNKDLLKEQIKQIIAEEDYLEDHLESSFKFSGIAILSYNREKHADYVCETHKASRFDLLMSKFGVSFHHTKFREQMLVISKAPEPGDVIWGNLGIDVLDQAKRILITNLMTILILAIAFGLIFGLSYAQYLINNNMEENSAVTVAIVNLLGLVASLLISVINLVLANIIIKFAELEQHATKTEYDISVAKKMGIAQFLNTAILTLIVNFVIKDSGEPLLTTIWKPGGLNSDVMLIFITNSIIPWFTQLIDVGYFYKLYVRNKIIREGKNCMYSQREANIAFEGPKIDLSRKYAQLTKTLMMAFFYAYLLPLGVFFTLASLIAVYWTEKFLLLKRDAKPPPTGSAMAEAMIEFYIELVLIVYSVGCCVWEYLVFSQLHWLTWFQLSLSFLYYVLPEEKIFAFIIETGRDNATVETYDEKYITFYDDYDRRNPVTLDKAKEAWMKLQQETITIQPTPNSPHLKKPLTGTTSGQLSQLSKIHPIQEESVPMMNENQVKKVNE